MCVSQVIRLLVSAGADATDCGLELDPLYLRAFPAAVSVVAAGEAIYSLEESSHGS
jgi:hypothetical protein